MWINNKIFILIAGANASGKSSIIKPKYVDGRVKNYLDPDRYVDVIQMYDNSRGIGEEQLLLHIEKGRTVYLAPEPPRWFREAKIRAEYGI